MTTTTTDQSPEQIAYCIARALRDVMQEEFRTAMVRLDADALSEDEYLEQVERIGAELHYYEHLDTYHTAEKVLLDWAHEHIQTLPQYAAHRCDLEKLFRNRRLDLRQKLLDTCMRLRV